MGAELEMDAAKTGIAFLALLALSALLGCVQEMPDISACKGEGETIPVIANPPECCAGLALIPPKGQILGIHGICTAKCGNGICDEATESNENCPQDCAAAKAQDYYDSEQQAFDALAEEISGLEEPSPSELESMLGQ